MPIVSAMFLFLAKKPGEEAGDGLSKMELLPLYIFGQLNVNAPMTPMHLAPFLAREWKFRADIAKFLAMEGVRRDTGRERY